MTGVHPRTIRADAGPLTPLAHAIPDHPLFKAVRPRSEEQHMATIPEFEARIHALWAKGDARAAQQFMQQYRESQGTS